MILILVLIPTLLIMDMISSTKKILGGISYSNKKIMYNQAAIDAIKSTIYQSQM